MCYFGLVLLFSCFFSHLFLNTFAFMKEDLGDLKLLHVILLDVMESD